MDEDEQQKFVFGDKVSTRIINDMIRAVKIDEKQWKLIVVDNATVKILNSAIQMKDLCEERVFLVESLEKGRKPIHDCEAIYFLTPSRDSIKLLLEDFDQEKHPGGVYSSVHLFFTGRVQNDSFLKIKGSPLLTHIKTLIELNIDFLVYESQVFHFNNSETFPHLFSPDMTGSRDIEEKDIAEKLLSICATLDEYPVIRHQKSQRCEKIAKTLQERLDFLKKNSEHYDKLTKNNTESAVILILDRSFDPLSPLLHEFTYQAMAFDLVPLPNGHFTYTSETVKGIQRKRTILLSEQDPIWKQFRHTHIADMNNTLSDDFKNFLQIHQPSKFQDTDNLGIAQMSEAVRALPQLSDEISKYSLHIELVSECNSQFKNLKLKQIAPIEQAMATGEDDEGKSIKNFIPDLTSLLSDSEISSENKLRLLMIYLISQEGIKESNREKLLEIASLNTSDTFALSNLKYLGVTLEKGLVKTKKKIERNSEYNLSRYTSPLKFIGTDLISDELSKSDYPYIKKDDAKRFHGTKLNQDNEVKSRRTTHQAKWGKKEKKEKEKIEKEKKTENFKGGKIIIFIAGGISYSEIRTCYELSLKFKREVIIGGSEILLPKHYVESIRSLRTTIGDLE